METSSPAEHKDTVPTGGSWVAPACKFCGIEATALPWPVCSSMDEFRQCFGDPGLSLGRDNPVEPTGETADQKVGTQPKKRADDEVLPKETP